MPVTSYCLIRVVCGRVERISLSQSGIHLISYPAYVKRSILVTELRVRSRCKRYGIDRVGLIRIEQNDRYSDMEKILVVYIHEIGV